MASWAPELPGIQAVLEYLAEVHKLKEQGNDKFKNGDFDEAQQIYTECLDLVKDLEATPLSPREFNPLLVMKTSILNNRGFTFLKMKNYFSAIRDLSNCISLCQVPQSERRMPSYMDISYATTLEAECKALYRRSLALRAIGNRGSACSDVYHIVSLHNRKNAPKYIVDLAKRDMAQLSDSSEPSVCTVTPTEHRKDKKLNHFGTNWVPLWTDPHPSPRGRQGHAAVLWDDAIYVLAGTGVDHVPVTKFEVFDLKQKTWKQLPLLESLKCLDGHTAVGYNDKMIVYGGNTPDTRVWQYCFKSCQWKQLLIKGKVPSLEEHTACLMDDKMYVFGGKGKICGREVEHSNNLYQLDLKTLKWKKICGTDDRNPNVEGLALPEPRYNHAMWTDNAKRRLYVLGGAMSRPSCDPSEPRLWFENSNTTLGDCWYFDVDKQKWFMQELYGNFPAPRCEFYAATTSRGAVMFGGFTSSMYTFIKNPVTGDHNNVIHSTYLGDAFEFQSASSSFCMIQTQGTGLSKRAKCLLVSDGVDRVFAVDGYHGRTGRGFSDVHVLDFNRGSAAPVAKTLRCCGYCKATTNQEKLRKCSGKCAGRAWYCSSVCQRKDWPEHRKTCGKTAQHS